MDSLPRPAIIVFDVNETLLDLDSLAPIFARAFGDPAVLREWFAQLILYSQSMSLAGLYAPFGELAIAALRMLGEIHGRSIGAEEIAALKEGMVTMPAHADAAPALTLLAEAGFRLATLTNSAPTASPTPLERAGLAGFFEASLSIETVRRFKPAPETYHHAAKTLGARPADLCLLACHVWDTLGAQAAGWQGALVTRPGNALLPAPGAPTPDYITADLLTLAERIITGTRGASD